MANKKYRIRLTTQGAGLPGSEDRPISILLMMR